MLQKPTAAFARDRIRLWRDSSLGWFCAADPSNSVLTGDPQRQGEIPLRQKYVISNHTLRGLAESERQKWDSSGEFIPQQTLSRPCQVSLNFELGSSWNQEGKMKGKKCRNQRLYYGMQPSKRDGTQRRTTVNRNGEAASWKGFFSAHRYQA